MEGSCSLCESTPVYAKTYNSKLGVFDDFLCEGCYKLSVERRCVCNDNNTKRQYDWIPCKAIVHDRIRCFCDTEFERRTSLSLEDEYFCGSDMHVCICTTIRKVLKLCKGNVGGRKVSFEDLSGHCKASNHY